VTETKAILMILPALIFFWLWASLLSKRMQWLEDREFRIIQMLDVVLANQYDDQELQDDEDNPEPEDETGCPECGSPKPDLHPSFRTDSELPNGIIVSKVQSQACGHEFHNGDPVN
jgi:hypothetical protein